MKPILSSVKRPHFFISDSDKKPHPFSQIIKQDSKYYPSGLKEFDRVLGGGFVPGAFILLGGSPGVEKALCYCKYAAMFLKQKKFYIFQLKKALSIGFTGWPFEY